MKISPTVPELVKLSLKTDQIILVKDFNIGMILPSILLYDDTMVSLITSETPGPDHFGPILPI